MQHPWQVFTNDTSATSSVTFATGDYIDFKTSLGRPAKRVKIILNGAVTVELQFNTAMNLIEAQEAEADTTVSATEGLTNTNVLRLFNAAAQRVFECPSEFAVENIKLVSYAGVASATLNLTFIGF